MTERELFELAHWITQAGLAGEDESATLTGFCERLNALGIPLTRGNIVIDTLHPVYQGRAFTWKRQTRATALTEYGRSESQLGRWEHSPFYALEKSGDPFLRRRVNLLTAKEFPIFPELLEQGITDYLAIASRFAGAGVIGDMDCAYSSWATDAPGGFKDNEIDTLNEIVSLVALTMKSASLARIAGTLVETYLGRDPGRKVLQGRIERGVTERIDAVLWFSDLRNYTRISDVAEPAQIIPLLNDYADAIVSAINQFGGDVLKLIGDGTLAIFPATDRAAACQAALEAAAHARRAVSVVNHRRAAAAMPLTEMYLGLHAGEVLYGNIGRRERLDFTVVGPAVNEVSRIANMCRLVDQPMLVSATFAAALGERNGSLVSVGRYALRGVSRPQELFTLYDEPEVPE